MVQPTGKGFLTICQSYLNTEILTGVAVKKNRIYLFIMTLDALLLQYSSVLSKGDVSMTFHGTLVQYLLNPFSDTLGPSVHGVTYIVTSTMPSD